MSTGQAKEDNLVQLNTNEKTKDIRVNNKINILEKSLNDVKSDLNQSSKDLKNELHKIKDSDKNLSVNVTKILKSISDVELEISQLYKDIDKTNVSINDNVQKIESEQNDLSSKVSETYKQLGSVEKQYSALKTKSTKITADIKKITADVETVSDEIRQQIIVIQDNTDNLGQQIESVETQSNEKTKQLTLGQDELIERTNSIIKDAKKTTTALENSIKENATLMADVESKLVSEIESLAKSTDDKTAKLSSDIEKADSEIKSHTAKMLLLQSVDEALEKRAVKLEETTQQLTSETETLLKVTTTLEKRTTALEDSVETLDIQVYRIEQENEIQQAQLDVLREKTTATNKALAVLSKIVNTRFLMTSGFIALLVIAVASIYLLQENQWSTDAKVTAQRTEQVNQNITGLTKHVKTTDNQAADRIAQLENQVVSLNQKLQTVNDKNVSLDNRLVNIAPHRKIGSDNILHSLQWIAQQADSNYVIKVLTASSEEEIFELAVRYNHNLTDVLSYKSELNNNEMSYVLFMGNYTDKANAEQAIKDLPFRLNGVTPELTTFSTIK